MDKPSHIFYVFIDGIGRGDPKSENPFFRFSKGPLLPLGGKEFPHEFSSFSLYWLDAHMGVPGIPQSATGQTALFTGIPAAKILNRHINGYPTHSLRPLVKRYSILKRLEEKGFSATLLNSYSDWYLERFKKPRYERLLSVSTLMQLSSGRKLFTLKDYLEGKSLYMDITNWFLRAKIGLKVPLIPPQESGRKMVKITRQGGYHLSVFEYFFSDHAGHLCSMGFSRRIIPHIEGFIEGLLEEMDPTRELFLLVSDHGNMEDLSTNKHTHNPVPFFFYGKRGEYFLGIRHIYEVPQRILTLFGISFSLEPLLQSLQKEGGDVKEKI